MVETDAPYMGFKGCRKGEQPKTEVSGRVYKNRAKDKYPNVPAALPLVVEAVAGLYGVTPEVVATQTAANARGFFGVGGGLGGDVAGAQ